MAFKLGAHLLEIGLRGKVLVGAFEAGNAVGFGCHGSPPLPDLTPSWPVGGLNDA